MSTDSKIICLCICITIISINFMFIARQINKLQGQINFLVDFINKKIMEYERTNENNNKVTSEEQKELPKNCYKFENKKTNDNTK